ncbi:ankyrin repeat-containing domain protein [Dichotomopilus funicola]|uniref:Ankyrin repeat-containing domain protein n=1 Tax=Dichotomopilus funicola TaxID=1934379 RepID=A0AAN6UUG9_9PEZI|nr:ankyrin repeat-containing domain protein [Dichotomopilus funicola]
MPPDTAGEDTPLDWGKHEGEIMDLLVGGNGRTLKQVMEHMRTKYNFNPSESQYKRHFSSLKKNVTGEEWLYIEQQSSVAEISSQLQQLVPERHEGDLLQQLGWILDSSLPVSETLPSLFALAAFFASNNLLHSSRIDAFLKWIVDHEYTDLLEGFMKIQTPTIHSFAKVVAESAIRIKNFQVLEALHKYGVKLDTMLYEIASIGAASLTRRILSNADPVRLRNTELGAKLLNSFVSDQQYDLARSLLTVGVSVDASSNTWNQYPETALYEAVVRKDIAGVKFLLEAGASVNLYYRLMRHTTSFFGSPHTVLGRAVDLGHEEMVVLLLEYEADMFLEFGTMPLLKWAALHCRSMFEILKEKAEPGSIGPLLGDVVDAANHGSHALAVYITDRQEGATPCLLEEALEECILGNHLMAATALLEHGVNPNGPTRWARPLAMALDIYRIDHGFVELLLEYDADVTYPGLLEKLAGIGRPDLLKRVLTHPVDLKERMKALVAACSGTIASVATILDSGVDINTPLLRQKNPLQTAASQGDLNLVLFLIQRGSNVNAPADPYDGRTALQEALQTRNPVDLAKMLLHHGADASAPPAMLGGLTALEAFCHNTNAAGSPEFCETLLAAGATVNRPCGKPSSVLHGVIKRGWHEVLRHFLEPPHNGIIDYMWCEPVSDIIDYPSPYTPTQLAASLGDLTALKILLDHGADVNEAPARRLGRTAFQAASLLPPGAAKTAVIEFLLERNANTNANAAFRRGITALRGAAIAGDFMLAKLLITRGAKVNAIPEPTHGLTTIEAAAKHGRLDMVQLLLNAGAVGDVRRGRRGFKPAIQLAEKNGHYAVAKLLKMQDGTGSQ